MATHVLGSPGHWRMLPTSANGQPAVAAYTRDGRVYRAYGIVVLTADYQRHRADHRVRRPQPARPVRPPRHSTSRARRDEITRTRRLEGGRSAWAADVPAVEPDRPGPDRADPEDPGGDHGSWPMRVPISRSTPASTTSMTSSPSPIGPAEDDDPVVDQAVHERGVLVPAALLPARAGESVVAGSVDHRQCEERHDANRSLTPDSEPRHWPGSGAEMGSRNSSRFPFGSWL